MIADTCLFSRSRTAAPVSLAAYGTGLLVAHPRPGIKSMAELIAQARARPGNISFGSPGVGTPHHMAMELFKVQTSLFMLHVPYTGAGPAIVGLIGSQVDALATGPATVVQHIKAGRLRALAHWGDAQLAALPDVPSLEQSGLKVRFSQWSGIFAPAGLPDAVAARLREAAARAATDERVVKAIGGAGTPIQYLDSAAFARCVSDDARVMAEVVRRIGKQ